MSITESSGPSASVFRLCYVSQVAAPITEAEFTAIGVAGRHNNARLDITGGLIHCSGVFFQILEGDEERVRGLCDMISGDPRHAKLSILGVETARSRRFPRMSMNCFDVGRGTLPAGYIFTEAGDADWLSANAFHEVDALLDRFYRETYALASEPTKNSIVAA